MDLYVSFADTPNGFGCIWVYNSDLFDAPSIRTIARHYRATLEETSANPAVRLDELRSLLTKIEHQQNDSDHKGLRQAALTLNVTEYANQTRGDFSSLEAEPTPSPF
jgi:hypothetical protein